MKRTVLIVSLSILMLGAMCRPNASKSAFYGSISGKVWDTHFNEPLVCVSVSVVGTRLGALTDQHGNYLITKLRQGTYVIRFIVIGYDSKQVDNVVVVANQNTVINCNLEQTPNDDMLQ